MRSEIEAMHGATARVTRLANQLLVLAKAEAPTDPARPKNSVNLRTLAAAAVQEWVPRSIVREVGLGFDLADAWVAGDAVLLTEALNNLIDNALRYTPPSGTATVRCGVRSTEPYFSVQDSGPGIPEWAHQRVFRAFLSRLQGTPGEGAGARARDRARRCGSTRGARGDQSLSGSGTRVTLTFAAVASDALPR